MDAALTITIIGDAWKQGIEISYLWGAAVVAVSGIHPVAVENSIVVAKEFAVQIHASENLRIQVQITLSNWLMFYEEANLTFL